jgi:2-amino-4-hydroxy-6-hydroxymethyldihydropteridine diphosphokinase
MNDSDQGHGPFAATSAEDQILPMFVTVRGPQGLCSATSRRTFAGYIRSVHSQGSFASTTKQRQMPSLAYLSLGSNVGDREAHLRDAIAWLETKGRIAVVSSFYETAPVEFTDQAWFLNCAVALETAETLERLIAAILDFEQQMGRKRLAKKGPRTIDIDILLFTDPIAGDTILNSPALTVPHPAMHNRRFVLEPLAEIAPAVRHPLLKKTIRELLDALPAGQVVRKYQSK